MALIDQNQLFFSVFEPKVQNRYILSMADTKIPGYMIKTTSAPGFTDEEVVLHHINTYRKIRGKRTWRDLSMTLYDPITPAGSEFVMEWARLSYESVTGRAGYSDFYKKNLTLNILGPVGDIVGEWLIKGAFIKEANFGDYDWSSSETVEISMTVAMDYCVLNF